LSSWIAPSDATRPATLFVVALIGVLSNVAAFACSERPAPRFALKRAGRVRRELGRRHRAAPAAFAC